MPDFPTSLGDFQRRYPDEAACAAWLFTTRWPAGFRCPACAHVKGWPRGGKPFAFECATCGKQTSVAAGTIMHGSKLPLTAWFWAACMATHSNGISALQLRNQLGPGSYKSAWLLCAKLGRGMVAPGRSALAGLAEVDEQEILLRTKDDPVAGGGERARLGGVRVAGAVAKSQTARPAAFASPRSRTSPLRRCTASSPPTWLPVPRSAPTAGRPPAGAPDVAHDPHVIGPMAAHVVLRWIHWGESTASSPT